MAAASLPGELSCPLLLWPSPPWGRRRSPCTSLSLKGQGDPDPQHPHMLGTPLSALSDNGASVDSAGVTEVIRGWDWPSLLSCLFPQWGEP